MPYIVTTKQPVGLSHGEHPHDYGYPMEPVSRRAVATLEEAREHVSDIIDERGSGGRSFVWSVESGGTVGPLPDGTVIEVEVVR